MSLRYLCYGQYTQLRNASPRGMHLNNSPAHGAAAAAEGACPNSAFIFIKPRACNAKTKNLVTQVLKAKGISIVAEGAIDAKLIKERGLADKHFFPIAAGAKVRQPDKMPVSKYSFEQKFGVQWAWALKYGRVLNEHVACELLEMDDHELDQKWADARRKGRFLKIGDGFRCAKLEKIHDGAVYVCRASALQNQVNRFLEPGSSIQYYDCHWSAADMTWVDFSRHVIGRLDPAEAEVNSLRGLLYAKWEELDLRMKPSIDDNCLYASASPLEALGDRVVWCQADVEKDVFGKALLHAGFTLKRIKHWLHNPLVFHADAAPELLYDLTRDMDATPCLALLHGISEEILPAGLSSKHKDIMKRSAPALQATAVSDAFASRKLSTHHEQQEGHTETLVKEHKAALERVLKVELEKSDMKIEHDLIKNRLETSLKLEQAKSQKLEARLQTLRPPAELTTDVIEDKRQILHGQLQLLKVQEIRQLAKQQGATEEELNAAAEAIEPRDALVDLAVDRSIQQEQARLQNVEDKTQDSAHLPLGPQEGSTLNRAQRIAQRILILFDELQHMKVKEIKQRAIQAGATEDELDAADEADKPKAALIKLALDRSLQQEQAAIQMQALVRGKSALKALSAEREPRLPRQKHIDQSKDKAATQVQAHVRGRQARKAVGDVFARKKQAAIQMQAHVRGRLVRKAMKDDQERLKLETLLAPQMEQDAKAMREAREADLLASIRASAQNNAEDFSLQDSF